MAKVKHKSVSPKEALVRLTKVAAELESLEYGLDRYESAQQSDTINFVLLKAALIIVNQVQEQCEDSMKKVD